jgi:hypothetical protein
MRFPPDQVGFTGVDQCGHVGMINQLPRLLTVIVLPAHHSTVVALSVLYDVTVMVYPSTCCHTPDAT